MSYNKHYAQGRRKASGRRGVWLYAGVVVLTAAFVYVGITQVQRHPAMVRPVAEYYGRAASWIAERKKKLNATAAAVRKNVRVNDDSERVVDFEFYNTLQEMQSMQAQVEAEVESGKNNVVQSTVQTALIKQPEKKTVKSVAAANPPKLKAKKIVNISQAADLERDLLAAIKQPAGEK